MRRFTWKLGARQTPIGSWIDDIPEDVQIRINSGARVQLAFGDDVAKQGLSGNPPDANREGLLAGFLCGSVAPGRR